MKKNGGAAHDSAMETRVDANSLGADPSLAPMKPLEEGNGPTSAPLPERTSYTPLNSDSRDD